MAGRGAAPKYERMRRGAPLRGDWIELSESHDIPTPPLPRRRPAWLAATRRQWEAWWSDPAAVMWGPADVAMLEQLAVLVEAFERGDPRLAPEIRLRLDGLGLTQKGKRDLRYRVVPADQAGSDRSRWENAATARNIHSADQERSRRRRLMAVDLRHTLEEG